MSKSPPKNNIRQFNLRNFEYIGQNFNINNDLLKLNKNNFVFREQIQKTFILKIYPSDITKCKAYQKDKIPKQFFISQKDNIEEITLKQRQEQLKENYQLNNLNQKELKEFVIQNQKNILDQWMGCKRFVYNYALNFKEQYYKEQNINISEKQISKEITQLKKENDYIWLNQPQRTVLTQSISDLFQAYNNFFKKIANQPKFKKKNQSRETFRIQLNKQHRNLKKQWENGQVILPKLGEFQFRGSHPHQMPKMVTVVKEKTGEYFIKFKINVDKEQLNKNKNNQLNHKKYFLTGMDVGIRNKGILSTGQIIENEQLDKKYEKKLRKENKKLSRLKQGGTNWIRQKKKIAKIHNKIKNIRQDLTHKLSNQLINENQVVVIEGLNIKSMMMKNKIMNENQSRYKTTQTVNNKIVDSFSKKDKIKKKQYGNKTLSKAIQDVAWGELFRQLHYKGQWYNTLVIELNQYEPTSQICSNCGYKNSSLGSKEYWNCPNCKKQHNRDTNAALNIRELGKEEMIRLIESDKGSINQLLPPGGWKVKHGENDIRSQVESLLEFDPEVDSSKQFNNESFEKDSCSQIHEILIQHQNCVDY